MNIRRATTKDLDGLNRLLYQVADIHVQGRPDLFKKGQKKYTSDELIELLKEEDRPVFAAFDEQNTMLGYAFCIKQQHIDNNVLTDVKTLYIDDLCVDENCRGQHVGKALYEYVLNYAKEQDYYNVTLNVWACNPSAMKFYEKMGLQIQKIGMETILKEQE